MSKIDTGGPAFPVLHWISGESTGAEEGMTLRDYFAASLISSGTVFPSNKTINTPELVAEQAYKLADAMLKERKK